MVNWCLYELITQDLWGDEIAMSPDMVGQLFCDDIV
jgi:hypothetical protein